MGQVRVCWLCPTMRFSFTMAFEVPSLIMLLSAPEGDHGKVRLFWKQFAFSLLKEGCRRSAMTHGVRPPEEIKGRWQSYRPFFWLPSSWLSIPILVILPLLDKPCSIYKAKRDKATSVSLNRPQVVFATCDQKGINGLINHWLLSLLNPRHHGSNQCLSIGLSRTDSFWFWLLTVPYLTGPHWNREQASMTGTWPNKIRPFVPSWYKTIRDDRSCVDPIYSCKISSPYIHLSYFPHPK